VRGTEWENLPLIPITDATFEGQPVPLDGYAYDHCIFVRCTFVYKGEKPFKLDNYKIADDWDVEVASLPLHYFSNLLAELEFLGKHVKVADELRSDEPIARGEIRRPAKPDVPSAEDGLKEENERLRAAGDAYPKRDDARKQRIRLCKALDYLHGEGIRLRDSNHGPEEMQAWEKRVGDLIEAALPEDEARNFLESGPEEQSRTTLLLDRLKGLTREILKREANPALAPVELRPGFDVWLWQGERRGVWPWLGEQQ
jgi:hypothetical protein